MLYTLQSVYCTSALCALNVYNVYRTTNKRFVILSSFIILVKRSRKCRKITLSSDVRLIDTDVKIYKTISLALRLCWTLIL